MKRFSEFLLLFLLIATSGFQYFYNNVEWVLLALPVSWLVASGLHARLFDRRAFLAISIALAWESFQLVYFGSLNIPSIISTAAKLLLAWAVFASLGTRLVLRYIQFITAFSTISLLFYALMHVEPILRVMLAIAENVSTPLFGVMSDDYKHNTNIFIFNFHGYEFDPMRNSGPFWEPGAFAIFISISLTFMLMSGRRLLSFSGLVQMIALFTTFSTSGYLMLFLVIMVWAARALDNMSRSITIVLRCTLIPLLLVAIYQLVVNVDFLVPKIQEDILLADETTSSRFGSALADIVLIAENPVIGYGRNMQAQYGTEIFDKEVMHRNNGLTRLIATWGIIGYLYLLFVFIGLTKLASALNPKKPLSPVLPFLVLLISGFSQTIFQYPFFMGLVILFAAIRPMTPRSPIVRPR